jgi:uncharacterized OsmC-like protein
VVEAAGDRAWTLRVRATGGGRATAYVRRHQFDVGVAVQFDDEYDRVTALEYALAALGADLVTGVQRLARRRRVRVDDIEALVGGRLNNPLTYLGVVGEEGHPGLETVVVRVYLSTDEDEARLAEIWAEALRTSPLARTLQAAVRLDVRFAVVP